MWTRARDNLPRHDGYFLVFDGQDVLIAWFQHKDVSKVRPLQFYNDYNQPLDITHWMPIPKPPLVIYSNEEKLNYERHV